MTTVTKALDHLTDVLAGSDVTLKGTKADCIMQLADMIEDGTIVIGGGGGGGGATPIVFTENNTNDGSSITYTLTNATAVFDAYEAVLTADDPLAASLGYIGVVSNLADDTLIYPAFPIYTDNEGVGIVMFADAAGDMDSRHFSEFAALYDGNDVVFFVEDPEVAAATRADIDPDTDTMTITYEAG